MGWSTAACWVFLLLECRIQIFAANLWQFSTCFWHVTVIHMWHWYRWQHTQGFETSFGILCMHKIYAALYDLCSTVMSIYAVNNDVFDHCYCVCSQHCAVQWTKHAILPADLRSCQRHALFEVASHRELHKTFNLPIPRFSTVDSNSWGLQSCCSWSFEKQTWELNTIVVK